LNFLFLFICEYPLSLDGIADEKQHGINQHLNQSGHDGHGVAYQSIEQGDKPGGHQHLGNAEAVVPEHGLFGAALIIEYYLIICIKIQK
jgi:hypothetical protein